MITIRNKYLLAAAGLWVLGLLLVLLGAALKGNQGELAGTLLTIGVLAQGVAFGLLGFVLMQAVFSKKK